MDDITGEPLEKRSDDDEVGYSAQPVDHCQKQAGKVQRNDTPAPKILQSARNSAQLPRRVLGRDLSKAKTCNRSSFQEKIRFKLSIHS